MFRRLLLLMLPCVALVVAGCGSDDKSSSGDSSDKVPAIATAAATPTKPKVEFDKAAKPPAKMVIKDLKVGTGPAVAKGDAISVHYVGVLYSNGKQFDSSYDNGQEFNLTLGNSEVIKGWDQGIVGMKVGGRRQLIIPPDLAYGKAGSPPTIPKNATLVFDIDLLDKLN